jgi:superfamily II DNA or RNA helicase
MRKVIAPEHDDYHAFLLGKNPVAIESGFVPDFMPEHLFDFQASVTAFALKQGRAGIFLDTGLGKTAVELEWSRQAAERSNGQALLLTPLAVAAQTLREAEKFGYVARIIKEQHQAGPGINICNYDRLDKLEPLSYGSVALDESSILKNMGGKTSQSIIAAFEHHRFRLAATATPAPNDHTELGQHSEFLGQMNSMEMLARWFINDTKEASHEWRLKKSAVNNFWDWVTTWARAAQSPEDLGFDGSRFKLEPYKLFKHDAFSELKPLSGFFSNEKLSATNIHDIKRQTINERAKILAQLIVKEPDEPWLIWVDTDYEADAVKAALPKAVEVRGSQSTEVKEANLLAFVDGKYKILITKPGIAGQGLNFQHCARMVYVGRNFSYESFYQSVRRCWRFGQKRQVHVHLIIAEGEDQLDQVIKRKAASHDLMKAAMCEATKRANSVSSIRKIKYTPSFIGSFPEWLK